CSTPNYPRYIHIIFLYIDTACSVKWYGNLFRLVRYPINVCILYPTQYIYIAILCYLHLSGDRKNVLRKHLQYAVFPQYGLSPAVRQVRLAHYIYICAVYKHTVSVAYFDSLQDVQLTVNPQGGIVAYSSCYIDIAFRSDIDR